MIDLCNNTVMQLINELLYADKALPKYGRPIIDIEWWFCHQCRRGYVAVAANVCDNCFQILFLHTAQHIATDERGECFKGFCSIDSNL